MSTAYRVGLVGCASEKPTRPAPARQLYVSRLFRKASACAVQTCDRWYVPSAKHGLIRPYDVIEPYDMRLGTNDRTSPPIHQCADRVREQLTLELAGIDNGGLIALAGEQYRHAVYRGPWEYEVPMQGLGIGQQLGWLTTRLSTGMHANDVLGPPLAGQDRGQHLDALGVVSAGYSLGDAIVVQRLTGRRRHLRIGWFTGVLPIVGAEFPGGLHGNKDISWRSRPPRCRLSS